MTGARAVLTVAVTVAAAGCAWVGVAEAHDVAPTLREVLEARPDLTAAAAPAGALEVAGVYLRLGVGHILTGVDHLVFVLALVLLTPAWRKLWKTVTAFTAAHSLTLALAALGIARLPQPPVEATIALSILFVAREVWRAERGAGAAAGLAARPPWAVAFAFGLLHGLGFAGALAEVGLPASAVPLALVAFNLGVELGQLAFVLAALLAHRALSRASLARRGRWPWLRLAPAYGIGALAAFWCIERVARFWI